MVTTDNEITRIKVAYARRRQNVPGGLYSRFNSGHLFMLQDRERRLLSLLAAHGRMNLGAAKILDVGCGNGSGIRNFIEWGAHPGNITGIDLLPERVAEARRLCLSSVRIECGNAEELPFGEATFDLVHQATVFTSILDSVMKRRMAMEMVRVLKPGGLILWYDYYINNPRNPDVRAVTRKEIEELFPNCRIVLQKATLAPPLVRMLAPYSWVLCQVLSSIPLLCTHYQGVIRKR